MKISIYNYENHKQTEYRSLCRTSAINPVSISHHTVLRWLLPLPKGRATLARPRASPLLFEKLRYFMWFSGVIFSSYTSVIFRSFLGYNPAIDLLISKAGSPLGGVNTKRPPHIQKSLDGGVLREQHTKREPCSQLFPSHLEQEER